MRERSVARASVLPLAALLALSLAAAAPLWGPGLLNTRGGGDSPFNLLRVHQLAASLRAGLFPARWMPDAAYGLGYPFFSYYASLPYYLAAVLHVAGLDVLAAIKLTQTLFFAAAALGTYGWAKRALRSRPGGWLAAACYTLAPYHLVNVYVRGDSLSEFAAFAFYPLVLWGLDRLADRPSLFRTLPPALALAGLVVTHNVSALLFAPFALLYALLLALRIVSSSRRSSSHCSLARSPWSIVSLLTAPLLIAFLLSAWSWLPALAETEQVQLTAQTSGYFHYGNHFRATNLVQPRLVFDYGVAADVPASFAAMGLAQAALALAGGVAVAAGWVRSARGRGSRGQASRQLVRTRTCAFALAGLALTTWLITPLSRPAWDHVPLLAMVQFPWRLLSVQALFGALLTGALAAPRTEIPPRTRPTTAHNRSRHSLQTPPPGPLPARGEGESGSALRWRAIRGVLHARGGMRTCRTWLIAALLTLLLAVAGLAGLRPEYLAITAAEVTAERLQLYELFTGNVGSTIRYEYLPRDVVPRPYTGPALFDPGAPARAIPLAGEMVSGVETDHEPTRRTWMVEVGPAGARVAFPLAYWPGWRAEVDGAPAEIGPAPDSGLAAVDVPAGRHTVELRLGTTPLRAAAGITSAATLLSLLLISLRPAIRRSRSAIRDPRSAIRSLKPATRSRISSCCQVLLVYATTLALLALLGPRVPAAGEGDLAMDFDRFPYLHHSPGGIEGPGWQLDGYTYSADRLAPGDTLHVGLAWQPQAGVAPALEIVSPAAVRRDELPPLARAALPAGGDGVDLAVPPDAGPGLFLLRLASDGESLANGGNGGVTYLRPIWIEADETAGPALAEAAPFDGGALLLQAAGAVQRTPERLDVSLSWSAAAPVAANYGLVLRLADAAGHEWARLDTQPGYGFAPTGLWAEGQAVHDHLSLPLSAGIPPGDGYTLTVGLYRVATWESVGEHSVTVALDRPTLRPDAPLLAPFGDELALSLLEAPGEVNQGQDLAVTAYWLAVAPPAEDDYGVEWRLTGASRTISATLPLAAGSPASAWPAGAWVAGRAALPIDPTTPPGDYTLSLVVRGGWGASLGGYTHPQPVRVAARQRVYELPPMEREVGARFGDEIELAGYDLAREGETLRLTLHWRALAVPARHYMLFVHLADPATGSPAAQVDTMPRGFTHPTGAWAPGEVVSDELVLSLEGVGPGSYEMAVGWYDPDDPSARLPAIDAAGDPLPGGRVVLPDGVVVE